jgi:hypothetical protein
MKRKLPSWLCALALLGQGCKEPRVLPRQEPPPPALDEQRVFTVEGATVRYNGKVLAWDEGIDRWQQVLGPRSRLVEEGISVWDELGVFVYHQQPGNTRPTSFEVLLGRTLHTNLTDSLPEHWPRRTFTGRLVVDGAVVHKGSTVAQLNREKKGPDFSRGYLDGIYSYYLGEDYYLRLDYGHDGGLTSFSISSTRYEGQ